MIGGEFSYLVFDREHEIKSALPFILCEMI